MNDNQRDELLVRIDENVLALKEGRSDHEGRIRSLEKSKYTQSGFMLALVGIWQWLTSK